jgi:amidase
MSLDGFSSACAMRDALRRKEISSRELVDLHAERIARHNPALNAINIPCLERAREEADRADADSVLAGTPITIKDIFDVAGLPNTGGGVRPVEEGIVEADGPSVARLRQGGGIVLGKTNSPPYAGDWQSVSEMFGVSNNPWDLGHTPGGSTGGGAAAVAAGLSPLELGSDIGGSIRIPAAFCGIYGHKPSETLIPRSGTFFSTLPNPAVGLAVQGPLARSPEDLDLALSLLAGPDVGEDVAWRLDLLAPRHKRLDDFRVAIAPLQSWMPVDNAIVAAMETVAEACRKAGAQVIEAAPEMIGDGREAYRTYRSLMFSIIASRWSRERQAQEAAEALENEDALAEADSAGMAATAGDYLGWFGYRETLRQSYRAFFRDVDVWIAPANTTNAFPHDDRPFPERRLVINNGEVDYMHQCFYAGMATLPGQPSTAFPVSRTADGLPVGLQAIGPYLEDRTPIAFAELLAREIGGFVPPPDFMG